MQTSSPATPASAIPVPQIDSDGPVAVIPVASAAPLDGRPDGQRLTTFALAPQHAGSTFADLGAAMREHVLARPLTSVAAAFLFGYVLTRAGR